MERIKGLLTPGKSNSAMAGIAAQTILEPTEGSENYSYAKGTLEEYKVNTANRTLDFEVTGPTRYQIGVGDLPIRLWEEISSELESVEWFKNSTTTGKKENKFTLSNVGKSQEGSYHAVVNGTRLTDINVVVDDYVFEFTGEDGDSAAAVTGYLGTSKSVSIPSTVTNYEAGWTKPSSVTAIKASAFRNKSLTDVEIPLSVLTIGNNAFQNNKLTSVLIPDSVTTISTFAFGDNTSLKDVTLGKNVQTIGISAFTRNNIGSIIIPDSVTSIGNNVFESSPMSSIKVSSAHLERIKGLLKPATVMLGVRVRTILEPEEGFSYTETTQAVNNLVEGESTQFGIDCKGYQLNNTISFNWKELKYQWMKEELELNNNTSQFDLTNVTESDAGLYHVVVGEGDFTETLPELEVNIIPRQDREIPHTNPESPAVNPTDPNPELSALGIRYVSSFSFGEIPFSKNQREVTSTELVDTEGNPMPHMITIQDAREKANRNGWELRVKQESKMMDGSELILNPYVHEKNSEHYGVNVPSTDLILNEESQRVASVEGDGNSYEPGIFSIGLSGSENEGVRLSIPSGIGVGKYNTTLTWNLIEGP
ncbi:MAG: leucine-rich repeat protein [Vagococcus sp.]